MLTKEELLNINGGTISGAILNALVRVVNAALEVGRSLGSAIRRSKTKNVCPV